MKQQPSQTPNTLRLNVPEQPENNRIRQATMNSLIDFDFVQTSKPQKTHIMIRSFSYKKPLTTLGKAKKEIKFDSLNSQEQQQQQQQQDQKEQFQQQQQQKHISQHLTPQLSNTDRFQDPSPNQKKIQATMQSTKYQSEFDTRAPSTTGMRTYYHTLTGSSKMFTLKSRHSSSQSMRLNPLQKKKMMDASSSQQQQIQQQLSQQDSLNPLQQSSKSQLKQRMSNTTSGNFYLQKSPTKDFYNNYFGDSFRGDNMGGLQTSRTPVKKHSTFGGIQSNQQIDEDEVPEVQYKTCQNFKNTQENRHLYFLNFMHDQKNPPKINRNAQIPSEEEIRNDFKFKLPQVISNLENPKVQINFLNSGWEKDFKLIEEYIEDGKRMNEELKQEAEELKGEIKTLQKNHEKELADIQEEFKQKMAEIPVKIKNDFVKHQSEQFRLSKEITKLDKDKLEINSQILQAQQRIREMESKMFGFPVFELQPNDDNLNQISDMNIRKDVQAYTLTSYNDVIH